jgi:hypothetical protein
MEVGRVANGDDETRGAHGLVGVWVVRGEDVARDSGGNALRRNLSASMRQSISEPPFTSGP